jgi:hypothetical protein
MLMPPQSMCVGWIRVEVSLYGLRWIHEHPNKLLRHVKNNDIVLNVALYLHFFCKTIYFK